MPSRTISSNEYRYGFNGKENDSNGEWGTQLIQDYGFRLYNPAIGKFLSVDPLTASYPWYTPYQFAGNKVITSVDLDGLEELDYRGTGVVYNNEDAQLQESDDVAALAEAASTAATVAADAEQELIHNLVYTDFSDPNRRTGGGDQWGYLRNLRAYKLDENPVRGAIANLTVDLANQTPLGLLDNWYYTPEEYRTGREGGDLAMSLIIVKGPAGKGGRYGGNGTYKPRVIERSGKGKASTTNTLNGKVSEIPLENLTKKVDRIYEGNPKHGKTNRGRANKAPTNPQESLSNSFELPGNTTRRVGADKKVGEFNVFDEHGPGKFHGHSRSWDELSQDMQNTLIKNGVTNRKGKIL